MNKQLAKINNASLSMGKSNGILSFKISVDYEEGCSQVLGGVALDAPNGDGRVGTAKGCELIRKILIELQVNDFSEMKGRHIWVYGKGDGFNFAPFGFSSLKTDNSASEIVRYIDND
jgi:hypothetical protein